jgi:predicted secreted protein
MSDSPLTPGPDSTAESGLERQTKVIHIAAGACVQLHLWEDRTRGELWVPTYDPAALALTADDFLRTASNNAVDAGRRTFEFRAVAPGTHWVLFEKRLGWKFTAEDRRVFLIHVADRSGATPSPAS